MYVSQIPQTRCRDREYRKFKVAASLVTRNFWNRTRWAWRSFPLPISSHERKTECEKNREANFTFAITRGICSEKGATDCSSKDCATRRQQKSSKWCHAGIIVSHQCVTRGPRFQPLGPLLVYALPAPIFD